jgi:hypothetical protein
MVPAQAEGASGRKFASRDNFAATLAWPFAAMGENPIVNEPQA